VANSNPVTDTPADPAKNKPVTPAPVKTPKDTAKTEVDPLEKFKSEVNGLTIYNFNH
jgi:hypothetical protein